MCSLPHYTFCSEYQPCIPCVRFISTPLIPWSIYCSPFHLLCWCLEVHEGLLVHQSHGLPTWKNSKLITVENTAVLSEVTRDSVCSVIMKTKMKRTRKLLLDLCSRIPKRLSFQKSLPCNLKLLMKELNKLLFCLSACLNYLRSCSASSQINGKTTTDLNVWRSEYWD